MLAKFNLKILIEAVPENQRRSVAIAKNHSSQTAKQCAETNRNKELVKLLEKYDSTKYKSK